jgi:hypothetical protein
LLGKLADGDLYIQYYAAGKPGLGVGTELVSTAIESLSPPKVQTVSGVFWYDNKSAYDALIQQGMTPEAAAWGTPFGKTMNTLGATTVEVIPGDHPQVKFGIK